MNNKNIKEANKLLDEHDRLYKKAKRLIKAGKDPEEIEQKYLVEARKKLNNALRLLND